MCPSVNVFLPTKITLHILSHTHCLILVAYRISKQKDAFSVHVLLEDSFLSDQDHCLYSNDYVAWKEHCVENVLVKRNSRKAWVGTEIELK